MKIKITKVRENDLLLPSYATSGSAGMDLVADIQEQIVLKPHQQILVPTGIAFALPEGYEAQVRPRSGLAAKYGITLVNSPGTIDSDYRGEVGVIMMNLGAKDFIINRGDRIAQVVFAKYEKIEWDEVAKLPDTMRGTGGFGSTGV